MCVNGEADGHFSLYEDDGLTDGYQRGAFVRIAMACVPQGAESRARSGRPDPDADDRPRVGEYSGMPGTRAFTVVPVGPAASAGYQGMAAPGRRVTSGGGTVRVRF